MFGICLIRIESFVISSNFIEINLKIKTIRS